MQIWDETYGSVSTAPVRAISRGEDAQIAYANYTCLRMQDEISRYSGRRTFTMMRAFRG